MQENIFIEIANEIKSLNNGAMQCIKKEDYQNAAILYRKALVITEKISFYEGMAMTLFNMANLAFIVGDFIEALKNAADAKDMFQKAGSDFEHCVLLISELALIIKKKGIENEKTGKFEKAIEYFEACLPFMDEKNQNTITHEINLLRRVICDR